MANTRHPSDPMESFRFIREQTLASQCVVVCGSSTARDQTLTFDIAVASPGPGAGSRGSFLPKPAHLNAGVITGDVVKKARFQVPAAVIRFLDSTSSLCRSRRKRTMLSQPEPHLQPPSHATIMYSQHRCVVYKGEDGFIGDLLNPYDVGSKTGRSICWAEGRYLNGQISLEGVFVKTAVQTKRCSQCVEKGKNRICRVLVEGGKDDPFTGMTGKCVHCANYWPSCSLVHAKKK